MDDVEAEREMPADVLEEHAPRADLDDDAPDVRPEVALVLRAEALPGGAEGLARVARSEEIHDATPLSAAEGLEIVPDRCAIQGLVRHPGHESGCSVGFPLDVTHSAISGLGDVHAKLEPSGAGAERDAVECAPASGGTPGT